MAVIGEGLPAEPVPGVRGADLGPDDALRDEWDVVVMAPHFTAALLARDLGDSGPEADRRFEFALTYERDVVSAAAEALLSRVVPSTASAGAGPPSSPGARDSAQAKRYPDTAGAIASAVSPSSPAHMLLRALEATTNGVTIADVTRPDHPLVFVNTAFERFSGYRADQVLGTNCRFLQGPGTDAAAVGRIRRGIAEGREFSETILNYRHGTNDAWWNEIHFAPVRDDAGTVLQYIGIQNDVTARVTAELALKEERARAETYLAEMEALAFNDPLTGLSNRRRMPDLLDGLIGEARTRGTGVALLYLDVDHFKAVNDGFGHLVGDTVLRRIGDQLRSAPGSLKARLGGDEFMVALVDLDHETAAREASLVAEDLNKRLRGELSDLGVSVSIGVSTFPADGADFDTLLNAADRRMYRGKGQRRSTHVEPLPA